MGKVQRVEEDASSLDVGFFAKGSQEGYAYFVEYGRRATKTTVKGNPTLFQSIKVWLRKKNRGQRGMTDDFKASSKKARMTQEQYLNMLAAKITRSIHKKGTKPHPFFAPAVEKNKASIEDAISNSVKEVL